MAVYQFQNSPQAVVEALREARQRIASPANWIRRKLAVDAHGTPCHPAAKRARCWCVEGAIRRACGFNGPLWTDCARVLRIAISLPRRACLFDWNDDKRRTHAQVLAALDCAIEHAEEIMQMPEIAA